MPSPFPGMNPYLEHPELWPEVHNRLIMALANAIESNLSRKVTVQGVDISKLRNQQVAARLTR